MNTIIARLTIQDGKEGEAFAALEKMAAAVQAEEPSTLAYLIHRSRENPSEIVFLEVYSDAAALQSHGQTAHMGEFRGTFAELFDAPKTKIEPLERVGGFVRPEAGG